MSPEPLRRATSVSRFHRWMRLATWALGLAAAQVCAAADGSLTITLENDFFTGSDNNYTNGLGIAWVSPAVRADDAGFVGRWARFWSFLPFVGDDGYATYASWSLAQEMNTPGDITIANPSADDQPYSGILYVDSTLYARGRNAAHAWQLKTGVAGPASGAHRVQNNFHRIFGAERAEGWHTQLPNEPVINLTYTTAQVAAQGRAGTSAQWRVVPVGTVGIGNYFTGAGAGVYGEFGWNLADALGVTALRSGLNAASTVGVGPTDRWSVAFFAGIGAYLVGHYLPLDGTMFKDSRSVDSERTIAMGSAGFCLRKDGMTLSMAWTRFGKTFETERKRTDFGTVSLSWVH